uniref:Uncharacterized protein n=1 Tax=Anguilla anguilla TaxID=7936 RepID=A0A0E9QGR6_ANGAN
MISRGLPTLLLESCQTCLFWLPST